MSKATWHCHECGASWPDGEAQPCECPFERLVLASGLCVYDLSAYVDQVEVVDERPGEDGETVFTFRDRDGQKS